jgi:hypothetical protein
MQMLPLALSAAMLISAFAGPSAAEGPPSPDSYALAYLADRAEIVDVIGSVGFHADQRQWELVAAAFTDPAVIDYRSSETAAAGKTAPAELSPEAIVTAWQSQLPGYLHTQHLITNPIVTIDGDRASVTSQVYATHFLPNDSAEDYWVFVGFYEHELTRTEGGWKISLIRANKLFDLGNKDLPKRASERVARGEIATTP